MELVKKALAPGKATFDRRVERRIEEKSVDYARKEDFDALSAGVAAVNAELLEATADLRRWLADDLDAGQETTALLGQSLAQLTDSVERLGAELAALNERVARIQSLLEERPSPSAG